jgi:dihydrofolate reductase
MPGRTVIQAAISLDGRIAGADGDIHWLDPFPPEAFGIDAFIAGLDAVVMGRKSYDETIGFGDWYLTQVPEVIVTTHRAIENPPPNVHSELGEIGQMLSRLRARTFRDIWLFGGADTWVQALEADMVDVIDLVIVPVVLGDGPVWLPRARLQGRFVSVSAAAHASGAVRMILERAS